MGMGLGPMGFRNISAFLGDHLDLQGLLICSPPIAPSPAGRGNGFLPVLLAGLSDGHPVAPFL